MQKEYQLKVLETEIENKKRQIAQAKKDLDEELALRRQYLEKAEANIHSLLTKQYEMERDLLLLQLGLEVGTILERVDGVNEIGVSKRVTVVGAHKASWHTNDIAINIVVTKTMEGGPPYKVPRTIWRDELKNYRVYRRAPKKRSTK
jgi:hypothetical protein